MLPFALEVVKVSTFVAGSYPKPTSASTPSAVVRIMFNSFFDSLTLTCGASLSSLVVISIELSTVPSLNLLFSIELSFVSSSSWIFSSALSIRSVKLASTPSILASTPSILAFNALSVLRKSFVRLLSTVSIFSSTTFSVSFDSAKEFLIELITSSTDNEASYFMLLAVPLT